MARALEEKCQKEHLFTLQQAVELLEGKKPLILPVTGGHLLLVELHKFDGLLKCKQMLFTVVPFEGAGHSGLGTFAAWVAKFGQLTDRLTAKNGLYNPHTC